jgi:hypothetical protein
MKPFYLFGGMGDSAAKPSSRSRFGHPGLVFRLRDHKLTPPRLVSVVETQREQGRNDLRLGSRRDSKRRSLIRFRLWKRNATRNRC